MTTHETWHSLGRSGGAWHVQHRDNNHPGYEVVAQAEHADADDYGAPSSAAVLRTEEGYWAAENGGGCSCWGGVEVEDVSGPFVTVNEALAHLSEELREVVKSDLIMRCG